MILIVCTEYSKHITQIHLIQELLSNKGFESELHPIYSDQCYFNTLISSALSNSIKKAELILLLIQPYPFVDWEDPHDSFYMMIYSFMSSHPCVKNKTVYVTPFMPIELRHDVVGIDFMKGVLARSKMGHFSLFPSDPKEFLENPPLMDYQAYFPTTKEILFEFYDKLVALCISRVKKS